jgi:hypothetical protein
MGMTMTPSNLIDTLARLETMPDYLERAARDIGPAAATAPGPDGGFSLLEQAWHLADLEREGFGARIDRLEREERPFLPDFDGARVARERDYPSRRLDEGLAAFRAARARNLDRLRTLPEPSWRRSGVQEGVGDVTLADIPVRMAEHDASHRQEIEVLRERAR